MKRPARRTVSFLISLALVFSILPANVMQTSAEEVQSGVCGENSTWTLADDGTLIISGSGKMYDYTHYSLVPWASSKQKINSVKIQYGITSIGDWAFYSCDLYDITIPSTVTNIGKASMAFCHNLSKISFPNSISSIEEYAFQGCDALINIVLPRKLAKIENSVFSFCSKLEKIDLPDEISSIGNQAFIKCLKLASIELPSKVSAIGSQAFSNCTSLESVILSDEISFIDSGAFDNCTALRHVYYDKSASAWSKIEINSYNNCLLNATIHFRYKIEVSYVSMMSPSVTIRVGDTYQAMAYCAPQNATDRVLTWSTDNPLVATVDNNGVVAAKGPGKATITAKSSNGKKASCIVTVVEKSDRANYPNTWGYDFSNNRKSFAYDEGKGIPIERYVQAGLSYVEALFHSKTWNGNCFGMIASSLLFYKENLNVKKYGVYATVPHDFEEPKNNESSRLLKEMIEMVHISQHLNPKEHTFSVSGIIKELNKGNPVLVEVWASLFLRHELLFYDYKEIDGIYTFYIYDASPFVNKLIYRNDDDYYFEYKSGEDFFTYKEKKYTFDVKKYKTYDDILEVFTRVKNTNNNIAYFLLTREEKYINVYIPIQDIEITNAEGQKSIITNGDIYGDMQSLSVTLATGENDEQLFLLRLPTDTYTIVGSGDEVVTTSFADDYMSASVTAKSSAPITISSDLKEISIDTAADDEYDITYTTWDNIFDEMTLSGTASDAVSATLNDADVTVTGAKTLTASASVSDAIVSASSDGLANSGEITIRCEETDGGATIQLLNADAELTGKTALPERLTVDMPAYDLASGAYTEGQVLNFTKDDETIVYYTTDGSIPSADNGIIYSLPIDINKSMTVKAISTKYGYSDSEVLELNYTLPEIDAPLADMASGEYDKVITVELSTGSYDDEIYYTLDGSNPLENGILYTVPLNISEDTYLQAYTLRNGCISEISEYEYTITPKHPFYISNSLTNQNGEIITADNISDITKVRLTVSKLQEGEHTGIFFVEFYDAEENLLSTKSMEVIISEDTDVVEVDITDDVSTACTVKAFACEDLSGGQLMCEEHKETFRDVAEENLAAAEETKETVSALADGSAETSAIIGEINAEIDIMLEDGTISADEAAKINTLKKQAQMRCGVLNLRFQIASGTTGESEKSDMRFISTVDSPNYRETGFYITINGTKKRIATRNVYSSLVGKDGSAVTTYAPEDIFSESKWFSTYSIWNIPNSAFDSPITVQAFVVNPDGTETLGVEKTRTVRNFIKK